MLSLPQDNPVYCDEQKGAAADKTTLVRTLTVKQAMFTFTYLTGDLVCCYKYKLLCLKTKSRCSMMLSKHHKTSVWRLAWAMSITVSYQQSMLDSSSPKSTRVVLVSENTHMFLEVKSNAYM